MGVDWASQNSDGSHNTFSYMPAHQTTRNIARHWDPLRRQEIEVRERTVTMDRSGRTSVITEERIGGGPWRILQENIVVSSDPAADERSPGGSEWFGPTSGLGSATTTAAAGRAFRSFGEAAAAGRAAGQAGVRNSSPGTRSSSSEDRRADAARQIAELIKYAAVTTGDDRSGIGEWSSSTSNRFIEPNEEDKTEEELTVTGNIDINPKPTMNPTMAQGSDPWVWEFVKKKTKNIFEFIKLNSNKAIKSIKPKEIFSWFYK